MRPWNQYAYRIREGAAWIGADGCSWASQIFYLACLEHDIHYRTHADVDGKPITKVESDRRFLQFMQELSWFGVFSPISWIRYIAVRLFGGRAWNNGVRHAEV